MEVKSCSQLRFDAVGCSRGPSFQHVVVSREAQVGYDREPESGSFHRATKQWRARADRGRMIGYFSRATKDGYLRPRAIQPLKIDNTSFLNVAMFC
jgi:hypothetical protein